VEVVEQERGSGRPGRAQKLTPEGNGYFSGVAAFLRPGSTYGFRLDAGDRLYPDPASRFQPDGPHGPSQVVEPSFPWTCNDFAGATSKGQVIYEMHVGTFTKEGTYAAAAEQLGELKDLGITVLELMPVAEFPGRFGWGYDGVNLWAPTRLYGTPDDLRRFVDQAHTHGIAVILDVVYNHLGPDGNYLKCFARDYFTDKYKNEWGEAINFDGPNSGPVREYFVQNAAYWIEEFRFDGLRLDATQQIFDESERHVIAELTENARAVAKQRQRSILVVAENEPQQALVVQPTEDGGYGCDALWNDDFHHAARAAMTGRREAYYFDYRGTPQELISALKWGYLYQGQHYYWQKKRRGSAALKLRSTHYVTYLQNHDQVANSLRGQRCTETGPVALVRAVTGLMLLAPATPMLFQGQEFAASTPFLYFADHEPELAKLVSSGRREFLQQFPSIAMALETAPIPEPHELETFERCILDFSERETHAAMYALHKDLLKLRREDAAFREQNGDLVHGAVLSPEALVLRFFCEDGDRLLVANLGADLELRPAPEPLLGAPCDCEWRVLWSSEDPRYGGGGYAAPESDGVWRLPARSTFALVQQKKHADDCHVSASASPRRA
jgi:maltooligosyltrehalose trehalohydrolase